MNKSWSVALLAILCFIWALSNIRDIHSATSKGEVRIYHGPKNAWSEVVERKTNPVKFNQAVTGYWYSLGFRLFLTCFFIYYYKKLEEPDPLIEATNPSEP